MLNKKILRQYSDPNLTIPRNHGLLHAEQVDFIVRTAVHIIEHRRTLILYIFDRKRAAAEDCFTPAMTMFQTHDDYITLARSEDGVIKWRTASFENLGKDYWFVRKCAFFSAADEQRVTRFFHEGEGFDALRRAQQAIIDKRSNKRKKAEEQKTAERMTLIPRIPRGLNDWINKSVLPAYFFCDHTSARRAITGVCSACGNESTMNEGAKHNGEAICPNCGMKLIIKSWAKIGMIYDRKTAQVVQRVSQNELVIRIIKAEQTFFRGNNAPSKYIHENARIFVGLAEDGKSYCDSYYLSYNASGVLTDFRPGVRPTFLGQDTYLSDICGHVYCANLKKALAGTPWQYCPIEMFYKHINAPMEMSWFLCAYLKHPRLEHLIKTGFFSLVSDLVYRYGTPIDETQNRTHRILKVDAGDVDFLRSLDVGVKQLEDFQNYAGIKNRQELLCWQIEHHIERDIKPLLERGVTAHKLMRYIDEQFQVNVENNRRESSQSVVSEYLDYLEMCDKLNRECMNTSDKLAVKNDFLPFPKDLRAAHDRIVKQVKFVADEKIRRGFALAYEKIRDKAYSRDGLTVCYPESPEALTIEGNTLHHCVGGYADRVADKRCLIIFIRSSDKPEQPYFTAEVRDGKVVQLRGLRNCAAPPEVEKFVSGWEKNVLQAPAASKAA